MRVLFFALLAMGCAVSALPTAAHASGKPIPQLQSSMRVGVTGEVPVDCSLTQSVRNVEIEDFASETTNQAMATKANLPFSLSCNTPVKVSLKSRRGGLQFEGTPTSDGDFTSLVGYSAKLNLPGNRNALSCESEDMARSGEGCSENIADSMMEGEGVIAVTVRAGGGLLQKGTYSDRVTITVTPALGSDL
jgi:spore coat protein U-like protein